jgi:23S rRNA (adenine2503-C2)-methyltransferase
VSSPRDPRAAARGGRDGRDAPGRPLRPAAGAPTPRVPGDQPARRPDPRLPPAVTATAPDALGDLVERLGFPRFHARQAAAAVFRRGASSFAGMTDLPGDLRSALEGAARVETSRVTLRRRSRDGTVKLLVTMEDGQAVEAVLIPDGKRTTLCVSTEVGCPVRCVFCASGLDGLQRALGAHEVVEQVLHARRALEAEHPGRAISNLVLMGMGEPLLNYEAIREALRALRSPAGLGIGARRITLSTVGIIENMDRLAREGEAINLAVSLHAPDDATRDRIVPLNRRYGAAAVAEASRRYATETGRDVTFEYVLLEGINDSLAQARLLADLAAGAHINVNLIPHNRVEGLPYRPPTDAVVEAFAGVLRSRAIPVHVRRRRGDDIDAACGQLRLREAPGTAAPPPPPETPPRP